MLKLKKFSIKNKYLLSDIDELFDEVRGEIVQLNIDFRLEYRQSRIKDEERHKTTIGTRYGCYKFVALPFGLTNAPGTLCP